MPSASQRAISASCSGPSDEQEAGPGHGLEHARECLDEHVDALDREVASEAGDERTAIRDRRRGSGPRRALELVDVDAPRNDHDLGASRWRRRPSAEACDTAATRARLGRSASAAPSSSDSSMPCTVASSGVRGAASAAADRRAHRLRVDDVGLELADEALQRAQPLGQRAGTETVLADERRATPASSAASASRTGGP